MNIYFIGFRGTGKTTLAKVLAKELKKAYIDIDSVIEKKENKKIEEIFKEKGEKYFRTLETKILKEISSENDKIISTGGGIVISEENRNIIKNSGIVIYLTADINVIYKRIAHDKNRPPLTDKNPFEEIIFLLEKRKPLYEEIANLTIDTSLLSINESIIKIINFLKNKELI